MSTTTSVWMESPTSTPDPLPILEEEPLLHELGTSSNTIPLGIRGELPFTIPPPSIDPVPQETFLPDEVRVEPTNPSLSIDPVPQETFLPDEVRVELTNPSPSPSVTWTSTPLPGPAPIPPTIPVISILVMLMLVGVACFRRRLRWTQT
jgi:hypothetical protein